MLSIAFGGTLKDLKKELKTCLNDIPKEQVKYQNTGKYINSFNCYLKDVDAMRPILNQTLRKTAMYIDYIGEQSQAVISQNVLDMGKAVLEAKEVMR